MALALRSIDIRPLTAVLLGILCAVLFAGWFFAAHEKVTSERWVGFRGEARANEHLAAEMLIRELGFDAESRATLTPTSWLPETSDTVFVRLSASLAIGEERDAMLYWVSSGGHLVLLPPDEDLLATDSFLAEFGLSIVRPEYSDDEKDDVEAEYENNYALIGNWAEQHIGLSDEAADSSLVTHDELNIVARREYGDGFVTLFASRDYFTNDTLDDADNARLFADLMVGGLEPGKVWIIFQTSFEPLWKLIWKAAPFLVVSSLALLMLWLWHAMPAFGPRTHAEQAERRSIVEHIAASGVFVWRQHGANNLVESSNDALLHDANARHPGIARQSPERQAEIIARITGMPAQKVLDALHGQTEPRQREFTHSMQKLQIIRKEL